MEDNHIERNGAQQAGEQQQPPGELRVATDVNKLKLSTVVVATIGVLAVLFMSWVVYQSLVLLLLLFIALLIGTAIEPLVNFLRRGPFNRSAGILVVYTGIFVVIGAIGYIMVPLALSQIGQMGTSLQNSVGELQKMRTGSAFLDSQLSTFANAADNLVRQFATPATPQQGTQAVQTAAQTTLTVAEIFLAFITIFVVAFYWLTERTYVKRAVMSWLPANRANRVRRVWDDIEVKVGGWVRGQLTLMGIVGLLSAIGYFVIGVQYWPALALFIAIAEAIPLVGPYIGTTPAVLVALTQPDGGLGKALVVVLFAIVLQTIEGNVLVPRVMKNSVGISPLTVIISILLGANLAGLAGALVAVPIAGSIQVILQDIKAARESQEKFEERTEAAEETRAKEGELVVAYPGQGETKTEVK